MPSRYSGAIVLALAVCCAMAPVALAQNNRNWSGQTSTGFPGSHPNMPGAGSPIVGPPDTGTGTGSTGR